MSGSADDPVRLDPFQQIIEVGWPTGGSSGVPAGIGIVTVWRNTGEPWRFAGRLWLPGHTRWVPEVEYYICGPYQDGLGGDYAYSNQWRCDPDTEPHFPGSFQLPGSMADTYVWHCGYSSSRDIFIVNIEKVIADFNSSGETWESVIIELAGLGGNFNWRYDIYETGAGSFSTGPDGSGVYSTPLKTSRSGAEPGQIVTGLHLEYPFT